MMEWQLLVQQVLHQKQPSQRDFQKGVEERWEVRLRRDDLPLRKLGLPCWRLLQDGRQQRIMCNDGK